MRKLSTLIALVLCVIIGGVYAAWSYAQGAAASNEITREINMAQVNTDSNKGSIAATPANFAFLVDDVDAKDYVADLIGTGELALTFTPAVGADATLATNGIKMLATITVSYAGDTAPTYTGVDKNGDAVTVVPVKAATDNTIEIVGNGVDGTTKITAEQIVGALDFCEESAGKTVMLPTKASNDAFHNVLKNFTIRITITEVITNN
jgi:hypothetical protein